MDHISKSDDHVDDHVDEEIFQCLDKENPQSFFTLAGAGAGKTRSLVNTLSYIDKRYGKELSLYCKRVAIITYTNAACDEILRRTNHNTNFFVATIHSFLWELIKNQQQDIRLWIMKNINVEMDKLKDEEKRGRPGTAASTNRLKKIQKYEQRLNKIETTKRFSYNPNGENIGYDSINHSEVIKMASEFIMTKEMMQRILISKFPIILIDESQDTKKELVDALLNTYSKYQEKFIIGMFGDTMQKVYLDGKDNLSNCIPGDWKKPIKIMNHRSASRIVELANAIRSGIDEHIQQARSDIERGHVRLFIVKSQEDKVNIEKNIIESMSIITKDKNWLDDTEYQSLILEHHMAASRLGFLQLFQPLYDTKSLKQGVLDGTLPELKIFSQIILPLIEGFKKNDKFEIARIVKKYSPLLENKIFTENFSNQAEVLSKTNSIVNKLYELWDSNNDISCLEILTYIEQNELFELPIRLRGISEWSSLEESDKDINQNALHKAFSVSHEQMFKYNKYITNCSTFVTHQGVKGLEFPRVMLIIDDQEARGFLFSYEKLFGAINKTDVDIANEQEGKDNSISRTKRLFYVACTRAQKSLAVVAYTSNTKAVRREVLDNGWFNENEVEIIE